MDCENQEKISLAMFLAGLFLVVILHRFSAVGLEIFHRVENTCFREEDNPTQAAVLAREPFSGDNLSKSLCPAGYPKK